MKFSVFTVMMPEYDCEEVARTLKRLGYDGVEWRIGYSQSRPNQGMRGEYSYWWKVKENIPPEKIDEYASKLKDLSDKYDLEVPCLSTYLKPGQIDAIKKVFEASKILNCSQVRIPSVPYDRQTDRYQQVFDRAVREYAQVVEMARDYRLKVLLEIDQSFISITAGPAMVMRIAEKFDPEHFGVIFDPGNMKVEGMTDWKMSIEMLGPYLAHVHGKNCEWIAPGKYRQDGSTVWDLAWVPIKRGLVDWEEIIRCLQGAGYDEWISFEDFSEIPTEVKLQENLAYLKSKLSKNPGQ
ncbi:MAG: sugar phosphate isomerase/epimerase [Spirochaetaceae bacterium]|nr:MAG: sugar phosphate isomerase/epimerase [Spirochaetaceae bacterium]